MKCTISCVSAVHVLSCCMCDDLHLLLNDKLRTNCLTNKEHLTEIHRFLFITRMHSRIIVGQWQRTIGARINKIHSNLENKFQYLHQTLAL